MLAVLTEPVDVRLIEDQDWFEPWLVPLAIVLAGIVAALFSWFLHYQEQSADDRRQDRIFEHDRRMRDRDSRRAMLDGVFATMSARIDAVSDFGSAVREVVVERRHIARIEEADDAPAGAHRSATEHHNRLMVAMMSAMEAASRANLEGFAAMARLQLWFPPDHPIVATYTNWHDAMTNLFQETQTETARDRNPFNAPRTFDEENIAAGDLLGEFLAACRDTLELADEASAAP